MLKDTLKIMEAKNRPKPKYKVGDKIEYINADGTRDSLFIVARKFDTRKLEWYYVEYTNALSLFAFKGTYESKIIGKINDTTKS